MTLVDRFKEYAAAFELTFMDDDWERLERYFTENAVYSTPAKHARLRQGKCARNAACSRFWVRPTL